MSLGEDVAPHSSLCIYFMVTKQSNAIFKSQPSTKMSAQRTEMNNDLGMVYYGALGCAAEVTPNRRTRVEPLKKDSTNEKQTRDRGKAP
jgi:hypothetical protein